MSAIEVVRMWIEQLDVLPNCKTITIHKSEFPILKEALLALEKQETQLYCAYEQYVYGGLDFYGFFPSDKEAIIGLKNKIKKSYTKDSEYRFFKLDFSKKGIDTSLPVKEVLERVGEQKHE